MTLLTKYFEGFLDPISRISDKPSNVYKGITDNPHLFTGEAMLLFSLGNKIDYADMLNITINLEECRVVPGLYSRHPNTFSQQYKIPFNIVSHDEYNGICFLACAYPDMFKRYAEYIVNYGQAYGWCFHDCAPYVNPFKEFLKHPLQFTKDLISYTKDMRANPKNQNYVEMTHPPTVTALSKWRQPRDRAFYKLSAGIKPNIIEIMWLSLAIIITAHSKINMQNRGGTVLMAYFRMLAIHRVGRGPILVQLAHKYFNYKMTKRMSKYYPILLSRKYFNYTSNHPMTSLIRRLALKIEL